MSLSKQLWSIDWPLEVEENFNHNPKFKFQLTNSQKIKEFLDKNFEKIKLDASLEQSDLHQLDAKSIFLDKVSDLFIVTHENKEVGIFVSEANDWNSYYCRYGIILPEYRGHQLLLTFTKGIQKTLKKYKIDRLTAHTKSSNVGQIKRLINLGFNTTGYSTNDRWGTLIEMTCFLNPTKQYNYINRFCEGVTLQSTH